MTRILPTMAALTVLLTGFPAAAATQAPSPPPAPAPTPVAGPLVVAPPPVGPDPLEVAIDVVLPTAAAVGGWLLAAPLMPGGSDAQVMNAVYAIGASAVGLAAPGGALVYFRTKPFAWDAFLVSVTGGAVGMGAGFLATRLATGGQPNPTLLAAALGIGEGLGTATAFHLYRRNKPYMRDLDRLPEDRTDDPIEDWQLWKEKRNP